jgi:DHA2 family methylenomycin A resistance protein-like MFS transporter
MITLDATIVNVALGTIGADLGGSPAIAQWVVDGYTVAFASLLLLAGSLADNAMFSLAAVTAGFISAGADGWGAPVALALVSSGAVAVAAFVLLERTVRSPLVDPAIFRDATFTTAVAIGFLFNFCLYGSLFCLAVGLQRLRGLDALQTGFALLPLTAATAAMALLAGRLVPRLGEWPVLVAGLTCGALGATLVALNGRPGNRGLLLVYTVPIGFTALAMPAMTGLAMANGAKRGLGLSAGVFNTSRQAGGALGVAVLGTVLTGGSSVSLRPVFLLVACAYGLAVALAAVARGRAHLSVERLQPR